MVWQQLSIPIGQTEVDLLSEQLSELGAHAISIEDNGDQPIFEPPIDSHPLWPEVKLTALFPPDTQLDSITQLTLAKFPSLHATDLSWTAIEDQAWHLSGREQFSTTRCGERTWICPSWETPPEDPDAVIVHLDPGVAFGTGAHATTKMCLTWLDENIQGNELLLDLGCGSGILSIAALKLGAKQVYAVDIDQQAQQATQANAQRNRVRDRLVITTIEDLPHHYFDIVAANILANTLIELAPTLQTLLKPGGQLLLSGILQSQQEEILDCYAPKVLLSPYAAREEWICLSGNICTSSVATRTCRKKTS